MVRRLTPADDNTPPLSSKVDNVDNAQAKLIRALGKLPQIYAAAVVERATKAAGIEGVKATLDDMADALDLPPHPRAVERLKACFAKPYRHFSSGEWVIIEDSPPGDLMAAAQAKDDEWERKDKLRQAAEWCAEFAARNADWTRDAWLAAASEGEIYEAAKRAAELEKTKRLKRKKGNWYWTSDDARAICPHHHRRRLRKRAKAVRQHFAAALQLTGGRRNSGKPAFCDNYTLARWQDRQDTAEAFGRSRNWRRNDGKAFSAYDIMVAGAAANLNRLYVQIRGIEDIATMIGLVPVMITLTLPAEWHPNPSKGECGWTEDHTPAAADREIQRLWANYRTDLNQAGIFLMGMRVFEAHKDGCPHLHALFFVSPEQVQVADELLIALRPDPWADLAGDDRETLKRKAQERAKRRQKGLPLRVATNLITIDQTRARASTYLLKYLLKSLNVKPNSLKKLRKKLDPDCAHDFEKALNSREVAATLHRLDPEDGEEQEDHITDYDRYRALASERHWRRYALLGVHGSQKIWQRLYRMEAPNDESTANQIETWQSVVAHPRMHAAWMAMQQQDWAGALIALGAVRHPAICAPEEGRAKLRYELVENSYEELVFRPADITWSTDPEWNIRLSDWTWTMENVTNHEDGNGGISKVSAPCTVTESYPRAGAVPLLSPDIEDHILTLQTLIHERQHAPPWAEWCATARARIEKYRANDNAETANAAA